MRPYCPNCGESAELKLNNYGYYYFCKACDTSVGCHPGTERPLGIMANKELRLLRSAAHKAFDPLWTRNIMSRKKAYAWLAKKLKITVFECHIGMFNIKTCNRVIEGMKRYKL